MPIHNIDPDVLNRMMAENPNVQLVDVRTPQEYYILGHISQAQLIPLYELPYAYRMLNKDEDVIVTCQHGVRSVDACFFLQSQGFERLYNLQEGMSTWPGDVERDPAAYEELLHSHETPEGGPLS